MELESLTFPNAGVKWFQLSNECEMGKSRRGVIGAAIGVMAVTALTSENVRNIPNKLLSNEPEPIYHENQAVALELDEAFGEHFQSGDGSQLVVELDGISTAGSFVRLYTESEWERFKDTLRTDGGTNGGRFIDEWDSQDEWVIEIENDTTYVICVYFDGILEDQSEDMLNVNIEYWVYE